MTYYLATFKSQTQTYQFAGILNNMGLRASVIQTPREAQVSCGLSVKFFGSVEMARFALSRNQFSSFSSFFLVVENETGKHIKKI